MSCSTIVSLPDLEALIVSALEAAGTAPGNAASVARALAAAEADGHKGHGLSRVPGYAEQVRAGKVDGNAKPSLRQPRAATVSIDAAHGFAYPAFDLAIDCLQPVVEAAGIAAVGITRSHHAGALGLVVERLADRGLVAIMFANTPSAMAPWGGTTAMLGTNPVAFAAPRADAPPIVIDLALSEVARGRIMTAAQNGEPIPLGWATDKHGAPTTDAKAALEGTLLPSGGAKGAALALMVEILAAAVTGSHFADETSSFLDAKGGPPGTGQLIIAIAPSALGGGDFSARLATYAARIEAMPGSRLPGSRRHAHRARALAHGVTVESSLLARVTMLAGRDRA